MKEGEKIMNNKGQGILAFLVVAFLMGLVTLGIYVLLTVRNTSINSNVPEVTEFTTESGIACVLYRGYRGGGLSCNFNKE